MASLQPKKRGVMLSLVEQSAMGRTLLMFADAVEYSFLSCPARMTASAVKERSDIAYQIFLILRADMLWPITRINEVLGHYVALQLEGVEWNPLKRRIWSPNDAIGMQQYAGYEDKDPHRGVREYYTTGIPGAGRAP